MTVKKDMIDKLESNRQSYPMQEKCLGHFLSDGEKAYLFPLIAAWAGSDEQAFDWLVHERLSACNNQTPLQLCQGNQVHRFIQYIQHIEAEGFA